MRHEYIDVAESNRARFIDRLNELGRQGWRVVSVTAFASGSPAYYAVLELEFPVR